MSSHTPGPWGVDKPFQEPGIYVQAQSTALVCKMYHGALQDEVEANARLIAAAPDLLAALREAQTFTRNMHNIFADSRFTDRHDDAGRCKRMLGRIDEAIAKATDNGD